MRKRTFEHQAAEDDRVTVKIVCCRGRRDPDPSMGKGAFGRIQSDTDCAGCTAGQVWACRLVTLVGAECRLRWHRHALRSEETASCRPCFGALRAHCSLPACYLPADIVDVADMATPPSRGIQSSLYTATA